MRNSPGSTGSSRTVGSSCLGFTQWALLADPPAELSTSVIGMAPARFRPIRLEHRYIRLADFLTWSFQVARQEDGGHVRAPWLRMVTVPWRLARSAR